MKRVYVAFMLFWVLFPSICFAAVRIKDITDIAGIRENQIMGIGLVVGLKGTGDKTPISSQMMSNLVKHFGLTVAKDQIKAKNIAAVMVTANLPPFVRPGQRIDVNVSSLGDAKSLEGGILLQTPLKAANGRVYAVAQGPLAVGGYRAGTGGATTQQNVPTVGSIPGGAIIERDVPTTFLRGREFTLLLRNPDFNTAARIVRTINHKYGYIARSPNPGTVVVSLPYRYLRDPVTFIAMVGHLELNPDTVAKVVINERTGTIVVGKDVTIDAVSISHGNITVKVDTYTAVSQPLPFSKGKTKVIHYPKVSVQQGANKVVRFPAGSNVGDVVKALASVGASPRDIISILQAIKQAGALHAELVIR